eukprot:CAMPEP_0181223792 /NCGR_PEP_ID=MMETSP1096-20121128/30749_1 /TAXON_ID=156174 ORGANISM="Chrysochromulina ericina, Strain CCMP281" /NCGR_SAMPLE_ID=MMETSP1096 /ASSEMBLY_ACC=CAM_ASM_000453 /LENGTH=103 /DNA_ID=CAMNT_0023316765 /DNA_START=631 /DNA_END=942 /DNA_ORIENTATION=-
MSVICSSGSKSTAASSSRFRFWPGKGSGSEGESCAVTTDSAAVSARTSIRVADVGASASRVSDCCLRRDSFSATSAGVATSGNGQSRALGGRRFERGRRDAYR